MKNPKASTSAPFTLPKWLAFRPLVPTSSLEPTPLKYSTSAPIPPFNWPAFKPLVPSSSLELTHHRPSQIALIRNFFTSSLCKTYVSFLKTLLPPSVPENLKKGEVWRFNDHRQVEDEAFAKRLWVETGLRELVCGCEEGEGESQKGKMSKEVQRELWGGEVVGLNPLIRIDRYTKGQFFCIHYVACNLAELATEPTPTLAHTTWTVLLHLTCPATGCEGGETVFYPHQYPWKKSPPQEKQIMIECETGMLMLHKHGVDCMLQETLEVLEGEKWVIRTDLCVKSDK